VENVIIQENILSSDNASDLFLQRNIFPMMVNNSTDRAWNSKFIGEGSIDVGGPYRETFFEICKEL
jgi:hypothetical protein